ncbi:MAG: Ig-like domain-containing protein [Muribaculaceae bacterium]|nr:Ig-like domain-containing protein [Muribaculaceae bacterium]
MALMVLVGCASIGRPEGGARDEKPPVFVRSNPMPGETNVNRTRYEVFFDENIQLDDAFNKVIMSPAQSTPPTVRSLGKRVTVDLRDTLIPNTTYTIDFGDAIKDLNEGNVLDGFALEFATGPTIDSLRVSGVVLEARTLEPAQGMLVGIHSDLSDTAIMSHPFDRVARTNQNGWFTVRGLKPGEYHVYALNDVNRDNKWDRSEDVAFLGSIVSPSVEAIEVNDTLIDSSDRDSIVTRPGRAFYPDDVLLTWFNEDYKPQYLKDYSRSNRGTAGIVLGAPSDYRPTAKIVKPESLTGIEWDSVTIADYSATNDTVTWWIRDQRIVDSDTLSLAVTYPSLDSLENQYLRTDTLRFNIRPTKDELKKRKAREEGTDTVPEPTVHPSLKVLTQSSHEIYMPLILESGIPLTEVDSAGIRLMTMVDTVWTPVAFELTAPRPGRSLLRTIEFERKPGDKYKLEIDSATFKDYFGNPIKKLSHEFTVKTPDQYSRVIFTIEPVDTAAVIELLDGSDKVVRVQPVDKSGKAEFNYLNPGKYYARLFLDANGDGEWTTGSMSESRQPEEVAYFPKKIDARANWDVELTWPFYEAAVDKQKPWDILKNRPKLKKGERAPNEDADEEVDEWGNPIDRRHDHRGTGNSSNPLGGLGGFQNATGSQGGNLRR